MIKNKLSQEMLEKLNKARKANGKSEIRNAHSKKESK